MEKCDICGKEFETEVSLKAHMNWHKRDDNVAAARQRSTEDTPKDTTPVRKKRIPMGLPGKKMDANSPPGYRGYWFNDNWAREPDRINRALQAGYKFVTKDATGKIGTMLDDSNQSLGNRVSRKVGVNDDGSAITAYFMAIEEEFYKEDQALKQKEIDKIDEQIYKGEIEVQKGEKRYIPSEGIKMEVER